ncbi:hypothetical protein [Cognatiyoonia sp. IB215182]|uniref:hypothetical protein n=1 Tax=Cognatiyoonia sp. IB215182 TaxID=3097353 RepID=UPI002A0F33D8|nr:hypothetical protein [Cognatiyoonia sp. IB215182]MDX8355408.1 hypothetical protein [Cognatiyoonia sp. IB215182]
MKSVHSKILGTVSALALMLCNPTPLTAQSALLDDTVQNARQEVQNARLMTAYQAMVALNGAHTMMRRLVQVSDLRPDYADEEDGGLRYLDIEHVLKDKTGRIETYTHPDGARPFDARLHGKRHYNIRYRLCGVGTVNPITKLPEPGYEYVLMTILPDLPVSYGDIRELVAQAGVGHKLLQGLTVERDTSRAMLGILDTKISPMFVPIGSDTHDQGSAADIPECLLDNTIWSGDQPPSRRSLAVFEYVTPRQLQFTHSLERVSEEGTLLCTDYPDAVDRGLVIGRASFVRGQYTVRRGGDYAPEMADGTPIPQDWASDLIYDGGCRAPQERVGTIRQDCQRIVAGVERTLTNTYRAEMREVPPLRGYYLEGEAKQWAPVGDAATWEPHLLMCEGQLPRLEENATTQWENQNGLSCSAFPSFPQGTYDRRRLITDTHYELPNSNVSYDIRTYGDWETTRNACQRTDVATVRETRRANSCLDQARNVQTTTVSYMSGGAPAVMVNRSAWVTTVNRCASRNNDRDNGREYYDVDGDGRGDFRSGRDAREYARENGISNRDIDRVSNCSGSCNGSSRERNERNNSDGGGGGGGDCFLTTAIVERRGEADDGPTLTALRNFRDNVMANDPKLHPFIAEYYAIAPAIVAAIPADDPEWDWIESQIDLCVQLIEIGDAEQTFATYKAMVERLQSRWIPVVPPNVLEDA